MRLAASAAIALTLAVLIGACGDVREVEQSATVACDSCHETPPSSGLHLLHLTEGVACSSCHPGYDPASREVNPATHINGSVEASPSLLPGVTMSDWPSACTSCHGPDFQ
jgi:hypothetical protein